ncbi:hypothetical protein ASC95_10510 [Pelomonas sp. Root1217]|uniref:hypothetical protein n=1 Tax=Pelomonas sp. Root1217 TaxID=1736430 RepID=UPI0007103E3C|nr:hypothetical protein [Pelomonas sp. Root1217]KQV53188.1 hypothetical protein ASC95_10510 [Pelomonas sp. Root1217]
MYHSLRLATIFAVLTDLWAPSFADAVSLEPLCTQCGNSVKWGNVVAMSVNGTHVVANGEDLLSRTAPCRRPRQCSTAFALKQGDAVPMPSIDGFAEGVATAVANDGTAVGYAYDAARFQPLFLPVVWPGGAAAKRLATLAQVEETQAVGIDSSSRIIGIGKIPAVNHGMSRSVAMLWCSHDSTPRLLPSLVAATDPSLNSGVTAAHAITDDGYIVGAVGMSDGFHPAYWRIDARCDVSMPTLLSNSRGVALARIAPGQFVGQIYRGTTSLAAIWDAGAQITLEVPSPSTLTLNAGDADTLYGFVTDPDQNVTRIYVRDRHSNSDLKLPGNVADSLRFVTGVDPSGTAVGMGVVNGRFQPVKLHRPAASEAAR